MKSLKRFPILFVAAALPILWGGQAAISQEKPQVSAANPPYLDPSLPVEMRVNDLVSRMRLEEKVSQMTNGAPGIERLGIPPYNWWNEALHGVARAGAATVFPQAIGLAATWNPDLLHQTTTVISDEARAKYNEAIRRGEHQQYYGLTFWSPNINIFRDPRWGRGQETYGEDPYLTGRLAVAFVRGMQGDDPRYLKVVATLKHYAVHSGPEPERHGFDARVDERDLRETYLAAFRMGITEGKAASVMCAYNSVDGVPCCADKRLLTDILRREWGFGGYVVSDCGAISDIHGGHHYAPSAPAASALAVTAGCDLECGGDFHTLTQAVQNGQLTENDINVALKRLFTARFRLGMFDPPQMVPYAQIPFSVNDSPAHRDLALQVARQSLVLLKNQGGALPLRKNLNTLAVIGPNADSEEVLLGNYNGTPSRFVTPLAGIQAKLGAGTKVIYAKGSDLTRADPKLLSAAVDAAKQADAVVMVLGLSPRLEGEEMRVNAEGFSGGDRTSIDLPRPQEELLEAVQAVGKPVVLALLNGSAVAVNWAQDHVPAIVEAWYPGEEGGTALADLLFGDYNPAGRLPVTFYKSVDQLPPFNDYSMKGRTYRYFTGEPLYPFGYGLSYTRFRYSHLILPKTIPTNRTVQVSAEIENAGDRPGDEVAQLYLAHLHASLPAPVRALEGFQRISLQPRERRKVTFTLTPRQMSLITDRGQRVEEPGELEVSIGGRQPAFKGSTDASSPSTLTGRIKVSGERVPIQEP